jgi:hypothetical protein
MPIYLVTPTASKTGSTCKDTVLFFSKLATKLLEMAESINTKMEDLKNKVVYIPKGVLLAEIETPQMVIGVRYEYVEYIKRFGPPENGIFDEGRLEALRIELGIDNSNEL